MIKLGTNYGGWTIPKDINLNKDSIIYSGGVGEYISFDLLLSNKCNNIFNSNNNNKIKEYILESGLNNLEYKIVKEENIKDNIKRIIINI